MITNNYPKEATDLEKRIRDKGFVATLESMNPVTTENYENTLNYYPHLSGYVAKVNLNNQIYKIFIQTARHPKTEKKIKKCF